MTHHGHLLICGQLTCINLPHLNEEKEKKVRRETTNYPQVIMRGLAPRCLRGWGDEVCRTLIPHFPCLMMNF
jgi:hypothetical protein